MTELQNEAGEGINEKFITEVASKEPCAVPIVIPLENDKYKFDEEVFKQILEENDAADLPAVCLSVAGSFRKGKSFLLNFLLRYLNAEDKDSWLGNEEELLQGFSWRGGSKRDTTGIMLWNKVFKAELPSGTKVAVMLMDTQGAFDGESSHKDCVTVFALSTMISSIQVYNLMNHIHESDLQHLSLFIEYGKLATSESECKPFQSLLFLVRDWPTPYEYDFGAVGGEELLKKKIESHEGQHHDLKSVRNHINSCFDELSCYLMPHPGLTVAQSPHFKGSLDKIEENFKENMNKLAPLLLSVDNLKVKKINGADVTCEELGNYFRSYVNIFNGDELPEPRSMLQATAEVSIMSQIKKSQKEYEILMDEVSSGEKTFYSAGVFQEKHEACMEAALEKFDSARKLGFDSGEDFIAQYRDQLKEQIEKLFLDKYVVKNEKNMVVCSNRTPWVLLSLAVILYVLAGIFNLLYISAFANILSCLSFGFCLALGFCLFARWTGQYQQALEHTVKVTDFVWEEALCHVMRYLVNKASRTAITAAVNVTSGAAVSETKKKD